MDKNYSFDAYSPNEMARRAEGAGVSKANLDFVSTLMLAMLAGGFIAFGACLYTTAVTGMPDELLGPTRLMGGLAFSLGLILVVVGGAELFTGNVLILIAFLSGKVRFRRLVRNWSIVYLGNLIGSLAVAGLVYYAWQWQMGGSAVGVTAYNIAGAKMARPFTVMFCSGVLCNVLVCLAVWLCFGARSVTDKIVSIVFPITAFVALGFEHSIANMYFVPYGIMLAGTNTFMSKPSVAGMLSYDVSTFTISNFIVTNLIPVTLGNIFGGGLLVGAVYWMVYLRCPGHAKTMSQP